MNTTYFLELSKKLVVNVANINAIYTYDDGRVTLWMARDQTFTLTKAEAEKLGIFLRQLQKAQKDDS